MNRKNERINERINMKRIVICVLIFSLYLFVCYCLCKYKKDSKLNTLNTLKDCNSITTYYKANDDDFTLECLEAISSIPVKLSNDLSKNGWTIVISENNGKWLGQADYPDKTIYLYNGYHSSNYKIEDTLWHELGHYIDYSSNWKYTKDKQFVDLYNKYRRMCITEYGRDNNKQYCLTDRHEMFACMFRMYMLHRDVMVRDYREMYMYYRNN